MSDVMTPAPIRTETKDLIKDCPDRAALEKYIFDWVSDASWDLDCPESVGNPELTQYADILHVISEKWQAYWESISEEKIDERVARLNALLARGFTLDGILLATMSSGNPILSAIQKAENIIAGNW